MILAYNEIIKIKFDFGLMGCYSYIKEMMTMTITNFDTDRYKRLRNKEAFQGLTDLEKSEIQSLRNKVNAESKVVEEAKPIKKWYDVFKGGK